MKIIDIGICIDNIDPKGMGRIRCVRYSDYVSEKEGAYNYNKWSEIDPFIASPFLPTNINFIPEIGQAIKIINYDTDKEMVNQEYITGPFSTSFNFNIQKFSNQLENTTYGTTFRKSPNIINNNGDFINKKANNSFPKFSDFAINGKFGNDILFTKNGIHLRGGKLDNNNLLTPILSNNIAKLHLKKFDNTLELTEIETVNVSNENNILNYIIEYDIDSFTNPTKVIINIFNVLSKDENYNTETFTIYSNLNDNVKIIHNEEIIIGDNINNISSIIRNFLFEIYDVGLPKLNINDLSPFFFRPSNDFLKSNPITVKEKEIKNNILNNVKLLRIGPNNGLIWSKNKTTPSTITKTVKELKLKVNNKNPQTFSSITSDKIYLLSNKTINNKINFNLLNTYEYTQEDYLKIIDKNTFSLIRGEKLIEILKAMLKVLFNHRHNLTKPMVKNGYDEYESLIELIKTMENDILNQSIKIN